MAVFHRFSTMLVTGARGFVGGHVGKRAPEATRMSRADGDLLRAGSLIELYEPRAILHLAALARIPDCEEDPDRAHRINVEGTRVVARAARALGARLVVVSTDQVFDGLTPPYRPEDRPAPRSVYGKTKAAAEQVALAEGGSNVLVVRLHLVVGRALPPRRSATDELLARVARGETIHLFVDEYRTPIHVHDAARALLSLTLDAGAPPLTGTVHLGGPERLSRYQIGCLLVEAAGLDTGRIEAESLASYAGQPRCPDTSFDVARTGLPSTVRVRELGEALRDDFATK